MANLTSTEKLIRDIEGLRDSIQFDHIDLAQLQLSKTERDGIQAHIKWCLEELQTLQRRLWESTEDDPA